MPAVSMELGDFVASIVANAVQNEMAWFAGHGPSFAMFYQVSTFLLGYIAAHQGPL